MSSRHAQSPRGLEKKQDARRPTWNQQGRFGKLFDEATAADFDDKKLMAVAEKMVADFDGPKDGNDGEESGIPALYTYFGQFVDHDLTFDPATSFQGRKDGNAMVDFRTPAFDLDSVYGRGPGDQPYLYDGGKRFALGDPLTLGNPGARDLVRSPAGVALIGDPRNDENVIVSQLQGLFLRFHNNLVAEGRSFEEAQSLVCSRYQQVVLYDFLPRIVSDAVLNELKTNGAFDRSKLLLFNSDAPFMPVEFSGACYRFGHSMVRPGYRLNDAVLLPIFPNRDRGLPEGLTGGRPMISNWGIDWGRFIDVDVRRYDGSDGDNFKRLQLAYRIDTSLVDPLASLPPAVVTNSPRSLALRNLIRGKQLGLPSAQAVAKRMEARGVSVPLLPEERIIIGKSGEEDKAPFLAAIDASFAGNCPLWTYVLAEAMNHAVDVPVPVTENDEEKGRIRVTTPKLGPLGGRIVAEVIVGLMFADSTSILNPRDTEYGPGFALKDLVAAALC